MKTITAFTFKFNHQGRDYNFSMTAPDEQTALKALRLDLNFILSEIALALPAVSDENIKTKKK